MFYDDFIKAFAFEPTSCQERLFHSVDKFLSSDDGDIMVVNGYAGTGKTSAVAAIVNALITKGFKCSLMAPTGRSAKVLSQIAGKPACTIHKGIYQQKNMNDNGVSEFSLAQNKFMHTLFVVDEASLIGVESNSSHAVFGTGNLLADLVSFVRKGVDCRLLLIGDCAQLPPVELAESPALSKETMAWFGGVCFESLTTVVRQAKTSGILYNATLLRQNLECGTLNLHAAGFPDVRRISGGELIETLTEAYSRYGEDETIVVCRSNKKAIRYNLGIRSMVQFKEERLLRDDKLMIVKNCYQFLDENSKMSYIANGEVAELVRIGSFVDRYGLHFATATLYFPDYDEEITAKVILDTLESESASLTAEQSQALFEGVWADYADRKNKRKRMSDVREDPFYNALRLKYAYALTCHKAQGGQWDCVFIDCPFWLDEFSPEDLKWLYTALTRAKKMVYLVNFKDSYYAD